MFFEKILVAIWEKILYNIGMKNTVRQPQQERAIEKKNKIIKAGYELFSEKSFFSCTTPEIAARAVVSTRIDYGYFKDKRDILLCVLDIYIEEVSTPVMNIIHNLTPPVNIAPLVKTLMIKTIEIHRTHSALHETLHSLTATDGDVAAKFLELERNITIGVASVLPKLNIDIPDARERVHLAMNLFQTFSHEYVFDKHSFIDYNAMYDIVCESITRLFLGK